MDFRFEYGRVVNKAAYVAVVNLMPPDMSRRNEDVRKSVRGRFAPEH